MIFFLVPFFIFLVAYPRSPLRTSDEHGPQITARWKGETGGITVYDRNFTQYPLFAYGTEDILNDLLPEKIPYADQSGQITRVEIERLIENAWKEISTRK